MNPFMERSWGDTHVRLLIRIADELNEQLPPDLMVRAEESVQLETAEPWDTEVGRNYRIDVAISERWKQGLPPVWQPEEDKSRVQLAEPRVVEADPVEDVQRWLEVKDKGGLVITVIEVLSPTNKGSGRREYQQRRKRLREAGVNVVEIDLLRAGGHGVAAPDYACADDNGGPRPYVVCVWRGYRPDRFEVYPVRLRERLPRFRLPLRRTDADIALDLQPLIDNIYRTGRYYMMDFEKPLSPTFAKHDEAWVNERLSEAGLIGV